MVKVEQKTDWEAWRTCFENRVDVDQFIYDWQDTEQIGDCKWVGAKWFEWDHGCLVKQCLKSMESDTSITWLNTKRHDYWNIRHCDGVIPVYEILAAATDKILSKSIKTIASRLEGKGVTY